MAHTAARLLLLVALSYTSLHFGPIITLSMLVVLLVIPIFFLPFNRWPAFVVWQFRGYDTMSFPVDITASFC